MRAGLLTVGAVVLALGLAACEEEEAPATPTADVGTPTEEATATTEGTLTPTPGAWIAVIAEFAYFAAPSGYSAARAEIARYDTVSGAELSSFMLDGPLRTPYPLQLHGDEVHAVSERSFDAYALDGTHLRTMVEVPGERWLLGASLSGDGDMLAYIHTSAREFSQETIADTHLVIVEVASGRTLLDLAQTDERLADGFYGQIWYVWWADGDSHLIVGPVTQSDSPPPYAAVSPDGTIVVPTQGETMQTGTEVEPRGRAAVVGFQYLGSGECVDGVDKEGNPVSFPLRWVDLRSGADLASTAVPQPPYGSLWSADGTEMMLARFDCETDAENPERAWYRWAPAMAEPEQVEDAVALWRDWWGDEAVLSLETDDELHLPAASWNGFGLSHFELARSFVVGDSPPLGDGDAATLRLLGVVD